MVSQRILLGATLVCLLLGVWGVGLYVQQRIERCEAVPLLADNLLPNAALEPGDDAALPRGWERAAGGVQLRGPAVDGEGFVLDADGRSLQLMGIANYVQTPPVVVQPGGSYCFRGFALTDSTQGSPTRVRVSFVWRDAANTVLASDETLWQPVRLWQPDAPPSGWSPISAAFRAPPAAATLLVRIAPSSDDRIYLDVMQLRQGGSPPPLAPAAPATDDPLQPSVTIQPWPNGRRAALAFTFDWETAMGGLIHSRSVGDPYFDGDPIQRGLRMREGITTTLELFRPYGVRATYYATGYNFLMGNTGRTLFMSNPTYTWANPQNGWLSTTWQTTPWFAPDPYGTVQSDPAWYFGDLIPLLLREGHDIQSHTFSHFAGGLVRPVDWRDDIASWNEVAAAQGVPPARSLAFPWSSSAGMSDANWEVLAAAGYTSVTRLSDQRQYDLFPKDEAGLVLAPRCRPLPGHERILACPDFYLTPQSADRAITQIERVLELGGMIDLWAHTEEVVSQEQIAAWERVLRYATSQPDLWIAPLTEIADWQQGLAAVTVRTERVDSMAPLLLRVTNASSHNLSGLTLSLPMDVERVTLNDNAPGMAAVLRTPRTLVLNVAAGQTMEVQAWPAR